MQGTAAMVRLHPLAIKPGITGVLRLTTKQTNRTKQGKTMREYKELPIARIAGVWGAEEPVEGSLYLKLETQKEIEEYERGKASDEVIEAGKVLLVAGLSIVDHTGTKIKKGNILSFKRDTTLNGAAFLNLNRGIAPQVYLCRNNETNGIFVKE